MDARKLIAALSALLLALAAGAGGRMYLANDWTVDQVVRVNASDPYFELGHMVGWTNGQAWVEESSCVVTAAQYLVITEHWRKESTSGNNFVPDQSAGYYTWTSRWASATGALDDYQYSLACIVPAGDLRSDSFCTNLYETTAVTPGHWELAQIPCRLGVRLADANSTDRRDGRRVRRVSLPAEIDCVVLADGEQGAPIVVNTGFDGYLHLRLRCEGEPPEWLDDPTATWPGMTNRLTITRLLPGKLPLPARNAR